METFKPFFIHCVLTWLLMLPISSDLGLSYLSHISITLMFSAVFTVLVNIYHKVK